MWKRFNEDTKICMVEATKIAVRLGSPTVSLAHLFLAVVDYVTSHKEGRDDLLHMYELCVSELEDCAVYLREEVAAHDQDNAGENGPIVRGEARFGENLKSVLRPLLVEHDELITCEVLFSAVLIKLLGGPLSDKEPQDKKLARTLALGGKSFSIWQPDGREGRVVCSVESEVVHNRQRGTSRREVEEEATESRESRREETRRRIEERKRGSRRIALRELEEFGTDLVEAASKGRLDPVVARDGVIEEVIVKLLKYKKNNPLLIGAPGVGKTAIIDGVAQRIAAHQVPPELEDVRIFALDLGKLTAGTRYRGDFEERVKRLLKSILDSEGKIIIFIDEIHTLIGAGSSENGLDAANLLKPVLTDSRFRCIGATTQEEYSKKFEKDQALDRRFLRIVVDEPNFNQACAMIDGLRQRYADFHKVVISDEVIELAVRLSSRYITDRCLPDKAIDLIDEAASRARVEKALAEMSAADLKPSAKRGRRKKKEAAEEEAPAEVEPLELTKEHVAQVISLRVGVPVTKLTESDQERLLNVQDILHQRLVGQDEPIRLVSEAIWRARAGNRDSKRPIGAFLFMGPTGVGKTELAKTLAEYLFYDENALVRIDMSEYGERYSVSRLVGASPGYVGYEEGGQLDILRHKPYAVVLFDEVEKAHPDIFGTLLQIMDEGSLTDAQGRHIDFKNTLIIMTSNLGFGEQEEKSFGFRTNRNEEDEETRYRIMQNKVTEAMKGYFKPEFLNRLDAAVVFHSLEPKHLKQIIDIMVGHINAELEVEGREIVLTEAAKERIVNSCNEPQYGARPLRRALRDWVETPMAKEIISNRFPEQSRMKVDIDKKDEAKLRFVPLKARANKAKKTGAAAWNAKK